LTFPLFVGVAIIFQGLEVLIKNPIDHEAGSYLIIKKNILIIVKREMSPI